LTRKCHTETKPKYLAGGNVKFFPFGKFRADGYYRSERLKNGVLTFDI
jgi:hypothetical protein